MNRLLSQFLSGFRNPKSGFATAGIRRQRVCGAITLVNLSGFVWGIASDETAVNIRRFRCAVEPEFKTFLPDKQNAARGFAVAPMKLDVDMEFEISGSTGIMAAVPATAFVPVNSTAYFGAPTTGLYLNRGEVELKRDGFKDGSASLSAHAGVT
jgi:hypothetical protein